MRRLVPLFLLASCAEGSQQPDEALLVAGRSLEDGRRLVPMADLVRGRPPEEAIGVPADLEDLLAPALRVEPLPRSYNLGPQQSAVKNQGARGTCWAFPPIA